MLGWKLPDWETLACKAGLIDIDLASQHDTIECDIFICERNDDISWDDLVASDDLLFGVPDNGDWGFFLSDVPDFAVAEVEHDVVDGGGREGKGHIKIDIDDEIL